MQDDSVSEREKARRMMYRIVREILARTGEAPHALRAAGASGMSTAEARRVVETTGIRFGDSATQPHEYKITHGAVTVLTEAADAFMGELFQRADRYEGMTKRMTLSETAFQRAVEDTGLSMEDGSVAPGAGGKFVTQKEHEDYAEAEASRTLEETEAEEAAQEAADPEYEPTDDEASEASEKGSDDEASEDEDAADDGSEMSDQDEAPEEEPAEEAEEGEEAEEDPEE